MKVIGRFLHGKAMLSFSIFLPLSVIMTAATLPKKEKVIQIDVHQLLNARAVTTLTDGKLITWTTGIDGNGLADGYLTMSAALFNGDHDPKALPDNPLFPATKDHPEVLLHYSNNNAHDNQTLAIKGKGAFAFNVPSKIYTQLFLAFTSAEGASNIKVDLYYGKDKETLVFTIPDYYMDIPSSDPNFCYLAHDLAKWGNQNNRTEMDHHNIDLLNIHPDTSRKLTRIAVQKSEGGYLVFWAATGVTGRQF
ncbi:MAG: hypothetical protein ACM3P1_14115 [Candidatus Saccharibacteria bacterium]